MEPATHHGECELATPPIPHSHRMHHQPWLHSSWSCPASGSYPSWYFSALHSEWQARIFCDDYYVNASIWNVKLMRVHPKVFFFNHFNQAFLLLCPLDTLLMYRRGHKRKKVHQRGKICQWWEKIKMLFLSFRLPFPTNIKQAKNILCIYKGDVYTIDRCLWDLWKISQ